MKGVPVTISKNKYGLPVTPVAAGKAGLASVVEKGGMPILLTNNGVPMVLQYEYLDWLFDEGQAGFYAPFQQAQFYQDAAGTIPVTTFDQPVGKIVRGAGTVDLVQSVSASRPTMARWPRGGRRNLLYDHNVISRWDNKAGGMTTIHGYLDPFGGNDAVQWKPTFTVDPGGSTRSVYIYSDRARGVTDNITSVYTVSVYVKPVQPNSRYPGNPDGPDVDTDVYIQFNSEKIVEGYLNLKTLEFSKLSSGATSGIEPVGNGYYRAWITSETVTPASISGRVVLYFSNRNTRGNFDPYPSGDEEAWFYGFQLEYGGLSPVQVGSSINDVTEEGVESLWHLYNDGGDSLQTDGPVPAGTYGYAWIDPYGEITFDTRTSDGINPVVVADDPGRYLDIILREGDFSAGEKVAITDYWERRYK